MSMLNVLIMHRITGKEKQIHLKCAQLSSFKFKFNNTEGKVKNLSSDAERSEHFMN